MPTSRSDRDMPGLGWLKALCYEAISVVQGRIILTEMDFFAAEVKCGKCGKTTNTWVSVPPHDYNGGVFVSCTACGVTMGPLADEFASNIRNITIDAEKAIEICKRTKQKVPAELLELHKNIIREEERKKQGGQAPPKIGE